MQQSEQENDGVPAQNGTMGSTCTTPTHNRGGPGVGQPGPGAVRALLGRHAPALHGRPLPEHAVVLGWRACGARLHPHRRRRGRAELMHRAVERLQ
jgi:hypothetical protein